MAIDNHGFISPVSGPISFDGVTVTLGLVPAGTPVPLIALALASMDVSRPGIASVGLGRTFDADGRSYPGFAPAAGVPVALATSNASALPLPPSITMPQGASKTIFAVGDAQIDTPTVVNATASYNGLTLQQTATINPATPLALAPIGFQQLPPVIALSVGFNRVNFATEVIVLASSHPLVAAVPASVTVPLLSQGSGVISVPLQPVPVDTPVTLTATFNGASVVRSTTVPKTVDSVAVSRAELVVKTGSLKVQASSNVPSAVLTLSNAATGQRIGTMTNLGKGKYSFQGTVSPVTTRAPSSSFNATGTGAVAQKQARSQAPLGCPCRRIARLQFGTSA